MGILFVVSILIATFFVMEFVAWAAHRYLMHGLLWHLHYDHHNQPKNIFQKNDTFFLIFAIPSWLFIMFGAFDGFDYKMWIGFGIMVYGIAYFLFHEVLIHQRMKKVRKFLFKNVDNRYLKAIIRAHHAHHKHLGKDPGESYGLLFIHPKYYTPKSR